MYSTVRHCQISPCMHQTGLVSVWTTGIWNGSFKNAYARFYSELKEDVLYVCISFCMSDFNLQAADRVIIAARERLDYSELEDVYLVLEEDGTEVQYSLQL
jgi:hypothetical protein